MYNLIAYATYTLSIAVIIVYVGHYLYKYGQVFIDRCLVDDPQLSVTINKILLTGFYLVNLGAGIYAISTWSPLNNMLEVLGSLIYYVSRLLLILGIMHYLNIIIIHKLFKQYSIN